MAPSIGAKTAIVVNLASTRSRCRAIKTVAAFTTCHQALDHARCNCPTRCAIFVGLQSLRRKCEGFFRDNCRHRNLDPLIARPLMMGAIAWGSSASDAQWSCDALPLRAFRFVETGYSHVSGIAQHSPNS